MSQGILQRSWKILQESCRIFHNSCNLRINQTVDSINLINLHRDGSMAGSDPILQRCNDPAPCQWKLEAILVGLAIDLDLCLCLCIRRNENDSKWHQRWSEFGWGSVGIFTGFRDFGILDWILPTKKVESVIWRVTKKLVPCHVIWDMTQRRYYFTLRYVTLRYVGAGSHVELIMRVSFWDYLDVFFLIMFRLRYIWGSSVWDPWDETGRKLVAEGSTLVVTILARLRSKSLGLLFPVGS